MPLSSNQKDLLDFESRWWQAEGNRIQAINSELGLTPDQYYQALAMVIDQPESLAYRPEVVRRLRDYRDDRQS